MNENNNKNLTDIFGQPITNNVESNTPITQDNNLGNNTQVPDTSVQNDIPISNNPNTPITQDNNLGNNTQVPDTSVQNDIPISNNPNTPITQDNNLGNNTQVPDTSVQNDIPISNNPNTPITQDNNLGNNTQVPDTSVQNDIPISNNPNTPITQDNNLGNNTQVPDTSVQNDIPIVNNNSNMPTDSGKKKNKKLLLVIIVFTILAIGIGVYFLLFTSPKQVLNKTIDKGFDFLTSNIKNIDKNYNSLKGQTNIDYEITAEDSSQQKTLDIINNIDINMKYGIDYKNKIFNYDLNTKYKNSDLINANILGQDGKAYFSVKDITSKYIYTEIGQYDDFFKGNSEYFNNTAIILDSIKSALKNSIKDEKIEKTNAIIKINGKEEKVTKNYLIINNENTEKIFKKFFKNLKNNDKFIKAASKSYSMNEDEIKQYLDFMSMDTYYDEDSINDEEINEPITDNSNVVISVYTKGISKSFVGVGIEANYSDTPPTNLLITKYDNTYEFNANQNNSSIFNGTIKIDSNIANNNGIFKIEALLNIASLGKIKINIDSNIEYNTTIEKENIANSVNYNDLTEKGKNDIITKLESNKNIKQFISDIEEAFGSYYNYDDYDYDYDF